MAVIVQLCKWHLVNPRASGQAMNLEPHGCCKKHTTQGQPFRNPLLLPLITAPIVPKHQRYLWLFSFANMCDWLLPLTTYSVDSSVLSVCRKMLICVSGSHFVTWMTQFKDPLFYSPRTLALFWVWVFKPDNALINLASGVQFTSAGSRGHGAWAVLSDLKCVRKFT